MTPLLMPLELNLADFFTSPDLGPLTGPFGVFIKAVIGIIWAVGILVAAIYFVLGLMHLSRAKKNHRGEEMQREKYALILPSIGLIALFVLPALFTVLQALSHLVKPR